MYCAKPPAMERYNQRMCDTLFGTRLFQPQYYEPQPMRNIDENEAMDVDTEVYIPNSEQDPNSYSLFQLEQLTEEPLSHPNTPRTSFSIIMKEISEESISKPPSRSGSETFRIIVKEISEESMFKPPSRSGSETKLKPFSRSGSETKLIKIDPHILSNKLPLPKSDQAISTSTSHFGTDVRMSMSEPLPMPPMFNTPKKTDNTEDRRWYSKNHFRRFVHYVRSHPEEIKKQGLSWDSWAARNFPGPEYLKKTGHWLDSRLPNLMTRKNVDGCTIAHVNAVLDEAVRTSISWPRGPSSF